MRSKYVTSRNSVVSRYFFAQKMTPSRQSIINMANRLPKELWMAIISDDFRVYNRLVRAIPGLAECLQVQKDEHVGVVTFLGRADIPTINGQIHTVIPYRSATHKDKLTINASYGLWTTDNDHDPSFSYVDHKRPARMDIHATRGVLSRLNGPAVTYATAREITEIECLNGVAREIRIAMFNDARVRIYHINTQTCERTTRKYLMDYERWYSHCLACVVRTSIDRNIIIFAGAEMTTKQPPNVSPYTMQNILHKISELGRSPTTESQMIRIGYCCLEGL